MPKLATPDKKQSKSVLDVLMGDCQQFHQHQ
jgi:hypothetical protein